mgnify:CR=1 FL=1
MVEMTQKEMERLYNEEKQYIVTWRRIYKIEWMANYKTPCFQLTEIPYLRITKGNYALRDRYFAYTASDVNTLIKRFFIWDDIVVPYVDNGLWWAYTREGYKTVAHAETEQELKEKIEEMEKNA